MNELSPFEMHALRLGKLLGNVQSIEMLARLFLSKAEGMTSLPQFKEGDWVKLCPLTSGDDLRKVLQRYNKFAPDHRVEIDRIVRLRDALAHGRVFGHGPLQATNSLRLLKFERKSKAGKVQVALVEDMTEDWFNENAKFLQDSCENVCVALDWEKVDLKVGGGTVQQKIAAVSASTRRRF